MSLMANPDEQIDSGDLGGGSLADAIAAHLELKKEHGADPAELEAELESALAPANRDEDDSVDLHPAEPDSEAAPAPEPAPPVEPPAPVEPKPVATEPVATEPEPEPEPEPVPPAVVEQPIAETPVAEAPPAPEPEPVEKDYAPGEITGTIEFEWDKEEEASVDEAPAAESAPDHDVLEDVPDFFEETPEHDKLWFDEAPPRKFEF